MSGSRSKKLRKIAFSVANIDKRKLYRALKIAYTNHTLVNLKGIK